MKAEKNRTPADKKIKTDEKYHKDQFDKIPEEKRKRILETALAEFSSMGYSAANVNVIAGKAGISIGSMYQYFDSKENLFLTVIDQAYRVIESSIEIIDKHEGNIFESLDEVIFYVQKYSREYRLLNQIYLEATTQGLSEISGKLSNKMERISSAFYKKLLKRGIREGFVDKNISVETVSFCIDNIILLLQFSYSSAYYSERMKIFAGRDSLKNDDRMRADILYFLKKALSP